MRSFLRGVALLASGAVSLLFVVVAWPLLVAMRRDRHERTLAADNWQFVPYNDDDSGADVDDVCEQCEVEPLAYDGARFCGAACSAANEMHLPRGPQ